MLKRKTQKEITNHIADYAGDFIAGSVQHGTDVSMDGMNLFRAKGIRMTRPGHEVGYEQGKGNLFEFIESTKLTRNLANQGKKDFDKVPVTDVSQSEGGFGEHTASDDFRMVRDGNVLGRGQAKINNNPHDTARNFADRKYDGMQRVTTSDTVVEVKNQLKRMKEQGEISKDTYQDIISNLNEHGLMDPQTGITSGGTSTDELLQFRGPDGKLSRKSIMEYAKHFERQQYCKEIAARTGGGAAMGALSNGIVSSVTNFYEIYQNGGDVKGALKNIGIDTVKGGARGGATGFLSSVLRIGGKKANIPVISDASAATAIAGGVIDCGVSVYAYSKGEISVEELNEELKGTVVKTTATIYFTKAIASVAGGTGVFVPMAVYSVSSYVVTCIQTIIKNAKLNALEYRRIAKLNDEAAALVIEYRKQIEMYFKELEIRQRTVFQNFLDAFEYNLSTGENYDQAIYAIVNLANETGVVLQHVDFNEFSREMKSDRMFRLR